MSKLSFYQVWNSNETNQTRQQHRHTKRVHSHLSINHRKAGYSGSRSTMSSSSKPATFSFFLAFTKVFPPSMCILPACSGSKVQVAWLQLKTTASLMEGPKGKVKGALLAGAFGCVFTTGRVFGSRSSNSKQELTERCTFFFLWLFLHWCPRKRKPKETNEIKLRAEHEFLSSIYLSCEM